MKTMDIQKIFEISFLFKAGNFRLYEKLILKEGKSYPNIIRKQT